MLHIYCTAKLAKVLKVDRIPAPNEVNSGRLDNWYVRDIPLKAPLDALLFTNAETLYSFVHPFDRRENIDDILLVFQQRLSEIMGERPPLGQPEPYAICKTASRRILGCMNELAIEVEYIAEAQFIGDGINFENIEERLNNGIIGGLSPQMEFHERLGTNARAGFKPTKTQHLKIVK